MTSTLGVDRDIHPVRANRNPSQPLHGRRIVLTRPKHQAEALRVEIERLGGEVVLFPTLDIVGIGDGLAPALGRRLCTSELVVFVSPNAVWHGVRLARLSRSWPERAGVAAVGRATAEALTELGIGVDLVPESGAGAAALLALPGLEAAELRGRRIAIVKGKGGLPELAAELKSRGADVFELDVYERRKPAGDATSLNERGRCKELDVIVVTSGESLRNLCEMVGPSGRRWLAGTDLLVVSERIAELALELGFGRRPMVASGARDEQLLSALIEWKGTGNDG